MKKLTEAQKMRNGLIVTLLFAIAVFVYKWPQWHKNDASKTASSNKSFVTKRELWEYIQSSTYSLLSSEWGDGTVGEPRDVSAIGELKMWVGVRWDNVTCQGEPIKVIFENKHNGIDDAFKKNPGNVVGYSIRNEPTYNSEP